MRGLLLIAYLVGTFLIAALVMSAASDPCFWVAIDGPSNLNYSECK